MHVALGGAALLGEIGIGALVGDPRATWQIG